MIPDAVHLGYAEEFGFSCKEDMEWLCPLFSQVNAAEGVTS